MTSWTDDELDKIGSADELRLASRRPDGTLRPYVTIWTIRSGDAVYVRSAYGADNPWYRRARSSGTGRIQAGGVERDVTFEDAPDADLDQDYHRKYDRYGPAIVGSVVGPDVAELTLRLTPAT
jgi:hypothetical protein